MSDPMGAARPADAPADTAEAGSDVQLLRRGHALWRRGDLQGARVVYEQLATRSPHWSAVLAPNLRLLEQRLPAGNRHSEEPSSSNLPRSSGPPEVPGYLTVDHLYREVARRRQPVDLEVLRSHFGLVSVIVTSHDTERYVEYCIHSVLSQTYPDLEVIIVDDASSDRTPDILRRLSRTESRVQVVRLATNLGTYYAKNVALLRARGSIIFFQDSDDTSHPQRIELQLAQFRASPVAAVVRSAYSRIEPDTERVVPVNGAVSKLGLITMAMRREVFQQIGFFNCTTRASDEEYHRRVVHCLGAAAVVDLDLPLYYNTLRPNSLFEDMVTRLPDGTIRQTASPARAAYVTTYEGLHAESQADELRRTFRFPRIRDAMPVSDGMSKLANPAVPVVVSICSIPRRVVAFERAVKSLMGQCDRLHVYLDGYETVPEFLSALPTPVTIVRSQERPGLRDNGKFIALREGLSRQEDAYHLTVDDDIEYPPDYVNALLKALIAFDDAVVVGVHGVILKNRPAGYFTDCRLVHGYQRALETTRMVNILGTGTVALRARRFFKGGIRHWPHSGMADLYLALECRQQRIPMVCIQRPDGWLQDLCSSDNTSLYHEYSKNDALHTKLLAQGQPWGMAAMRDALSSSVGAETARRLEELVPALSSFTRGG